MTTEMKQDVVRVRPDAETMSRQRLPYFVGISGATAGARALSMNLVIVPPGGAAETHRNGGYETAIDVFKGTVDTRYGPGLTQSLVCQEGDFLYIAADVPHQAVNLSDSEPAVAIGARTDPNEQESVEPYDPANE